MNCIKENLKIIEFCVKLVLICRVLLQNVQFRGEFFFLLMSKLIVKLW